MMNKYRIVTLGKFEVLKNGLSLNKTASGSKKIWELYKFMLSFREKDHTPESLMDQLWVDQDYSDPRSTLRRQMHRLRQVLNEEEATAEDKTVIFANGYYSWNHQLDILIDVDEFSRLVGDGDKYITSAPDRALLDYNKAINLYTGDYLPESMDQHWIFSVRNNYRRLYSRAVSQSIRLLNGKEAYGDIIKICNKATQIDPYEETFQLAYMEAMLALGEHRQALEHYGYIANFYAQEMGLDPSDEMRQLYKKMLSSQHTISPEESLYEVLESSTVIENAFYCDYDVFKSIYELERRRSQRSGQEFSVGIVALPKVEESYSKTEARMVYLKQHLLKSLRKGDTVTRWSQSQFVVLLPGIDKELMEQVLERILLKKDGLTSVKILQITSLRPEPNQV